MPRAAPPIYKPPRRPKGSLQEGKSQVFDRTSITLERSLLDEARREAYRRNLTLSAHFEQIIKAYYGQDTPPAPTT